MRLVGITAGGLGVALALLLVGKLSLRLLLETRGLLGGLSRCFLLSGHRLLLLLWSDRWRGFLSLHRGDIDRGGLCSDSGRLGH